MLIQTIDPGRTLQQLYRLQQIPSLTISPEVAPVCIVDDLSSRSEYDRPGDRPCVGVVEVTGVAAESSVVGLVALPNTDVIVERVSVLVTAGVQWRVRFPAAVQTGIVFSANTAFCDRRLAGRPATIIGGYTPVALPAGVDVLVQHEDLPATPIRELGFLIPGFHEGQPPGRSGLMIYTPAVNESMVVTLWWRELNRGG